MTQSKAFIFENKIPTDGDFNTKYNHNVAGILAKHKM